MKLTTAFLSCLSFATVDSFRLRRSAAKGDATGSIVDNVSAVNNVEDERSLQWVPWCWVNNQPPPAKYHPVYSAGWNDGFCELSSDCNSPGYDTQLECCNAAYANQASGACYGGLPDPPTDSPTSSPTDSPTESPTPVPTKSPVKPAPTTGTADFWYPDYSVAWSEAGCSNALPLPYANIGDRPNYPTQLECCKAAFANQGSGACYGGLPDPPTDSPTSSPTDSPTESPTPVTGAAVPWCWVNNQPPPAKYHPVYSAGWNDGFCEFSSDCNSPGYDTQQECCDVSYGGQTSGKCISQIP